jgi:FkbM family methyltransferase
MFSKILEWLNKSINSKVAKLTGYRVVKDFPLFDETRNLILESVNIQIAIDGGANQGQWASRLRAHFPSINIHSFEPVSTEFKVLQNNSSKDPFWFVYNRALGIEKGKALIHLADNNSMSSSLRNPTQHLDVYPTVKFSGSEEISVDRLDSYKFGSGSELLFVKLDVQGFEKEALEGAENLLNRVGLIEIETSYRQMYAGELNHTKLVSWLELKGFEVFTISQPSFDSNGRVGYFDCLLINSRLIDKIT